MAATGGTEANRGWQGSDGSDACCAAGKMRPLLSAVLAAGLLAGAAAAPEEYNILQDLSNTCQANLAASQAVETACASGRFQSTINLNLLNTGGLQNLCWRQQLFAACMIWALADGAILDVTALLPVSSQWLPILQRHIM